MAKSDEIDPRDAMRAASRISRDAPLDRRLEHLALVPIESLRAEKRPLDLAPAAVLVPVELEQGPAAERQAFLLETARAKFRAAQDLVGLHERSDPDHAYDEGWCVDWTHEVQILKSVTT